jgi:antitoxin component YwqK of YwqJK toxin-antitoxin module
MGHLNGEWKSYYKKGKIHILGHYENDLKVGNWKTYNEKGKLVEDGNYKIITYKKHVKYGPFSKRKLKESARSGHWVWYSDKDGKKTYEGDYKDGKEVGKWIYYYPGGEKPMQTIDYKNGRIDGKMVMYNWRPHRITTEIEYKNGVKDGKMVIYDKRGNIKIEKYFKEGVEVKKDGKPVHFQP